MPPHAPSPCHQEQYLARQDMHAGVLPTVSSQTSLQTKICLSQVLLSCHQASQPPTAVEPILRPRAKALSSSPQPLQGPAGAGVVGGVPGRTATGLTGLLAIAREDSCRVSRALAATLPGPHPPRPGVMRTGLRVEGEEGIAVRGMATEGRLDRVLGALARSALTRLLVKTTGQLEIGRVTALQVLHSQTCKAKDLEPCRNRTGRQAQDSKGMPQHRPVAQLLSPPMWQAEPAARCRKHQTSSQDVTNLRLTETRMIAIRA